MCGNSGSTPATDSHAFLDCSRELQDVAVGGVVNDEDFDGDCVGLVGETKMRSSRSRSPKAVRLDLGWRDLEGCRS